MLAKEMVADACPVFCLRVAAMAYLVFEPFCFLL